MDLKQSICEDFIRSLLSGAPAPGGGGTVTVSVLAKHVVEAAQRSLL